MLNPTKAELFAAMKGKNCLHGWDVAVSYDLLTLNQIITNKIWEKMEIWGAIPLNVDDTLDGKQWHYDMNVFAPILKFLPEQKSATLTMSIKGVVDKGDGKPVTIDAGMYVLEVTVPIVGIHSYDGKVKTKDESAARIASPAHTVIQFPANESAEQAKNPGNYHLVFHFDEVPAHEWKITPPRGKSIARVNSGKDDKTTFLQPQSFMFTTHGDETHPVLTIYIKVKGGNNTPGDAASKITEFTTSAKTAVPVGHTASLIISNDLMATKFIEASLTGYFEIKRIGNTTGDGGDDGFDYEVHLDKKFIKGAYDDPGFFNSKHVNDANIDLKGHPMTLKVRDGLATWSLDYTDHVDWSGHVMERDIFGRVQITFHVNKTSKITVSDTGISKGNFDFNESDIQIKTTEVGRDPGMGLNRGSATSLPPTMDKLEMKFDAIQVPMHTINWLLTENIFAGHGNLIELDVNEGLKTPHDVLLVGKIDWKQ